MFDLLSSAKPKQNEYTHNVNIKKPQAHSTITPSELRAMFGANLRQLARDYPSVASLCRDLEINRTQFNRYLSGESFPRPDVLHRICNFFGVDARILLEPVADLSIDGHGVLAHPFLAPSFGSSTHVPMDDFPSGFYRFTRRSFTDDTRFIQGLVFVTRRDGYTFLRGYESRKGIAALGVPISPANREFRGFAYMQEDGIALNVSARAGNTGSFNFLARVPSFQQNFWEGYVSRTVRESSNSTRAVRLVYEHLLDTKTVLAAARSAGFLAEIDLPPFVRRLLRTDQEFA